MDISDVINFKIPANYQRMVEVLNELKRTYPDIQLFDIGKTYLDKRIICVTLGHGEKKAIYVGAHHATEWVTSQILIRFIYDVLVNRNQKLYGYEVSDFLKKYTLYIICMLNADGVDININKPDISAEYYNKLLFYNNGSTDFSKWQANIRGVDLNHNYESGFVKSNEKEIYGAPTRYGGLYPESEKETAALARFTRDINPDVVLALHSQGEEIYYDYMGYAPKNGRNIALIVSNLCGYKVSTPVKEAMGGGYKDWFIDKFDKPGFTLELGKGVNPLPLSDFWDIYKKIVPVLLVLPIL